MTALLIFLAGLLDRVRGDHFNFFGNWSRGPDMAAYAWVIAALMGHPQDWFTIAIIAALMLGMAPGWGEPMGATLFRRPIHQANLEWWQVGPLKRNHFLALTARGALWGVPALALLPWLPSAWMPLVAYAIAFPASIYLMRTLPIDAKWEWAERTRGWMAALIIAGMV